MPRKAKDPKPPKEKDKIWPVVMDVWFKYFEEKHEGRKPTFIGAAASSYKKLVGIVKQKTIEAGQLWDESSARINMIAFFDRAYHHSDQKFQSYIRQNFTLPNLLYHCDKILVFNGKQSPTSTFQKFARTVHEAQERVHGFNHQPGGEGIS